MAPSIYPCLYQVNTRVWLQSRSRQLSRPATLDDIPDDVLDGWASQGFDWIYLLGVWQTGAVGPLVSRSNPDWLAEYRQLLTDLSDEDVCGSCFAITAYAVSDRLGGNAALMRLRDRLHQRCLKLMLDFVPNHTAPDHPWVQAHPNFYVQGTEGDLAREPHNYCKIGVSTEELVFAYGRDPYFPGWPDTLQLNYGDSAMQAAQQDELLKVSNLCDGVRCDMAMLVLPAIFERTWGIPSNPFWPKAIAHVRAHHPNFVMMAEVYWDMEWDLQQQGFNYTYDKRLYDRLRDHHARPVREHFLATLEYQCKSARFLENHDEPRAAHIFPAAVHQSAAILTFLCPGLRFFHQGQLEGFQNRISIHLQRGPSDPVNESLQLFYRQLLICLRLPILRYGNWQLAECVPAWDGNDTWDNAIAFHWHYGGDRLLVAVNYAPYAGQCYVRFPFNFPEPIVQFRDLMNPVQYDRTAESLQSSGLYLDLPGWGYHVFEVLHRPHE